jgi:hypothetical protein
VHNVRFLIIGGHAAIYYGVNRNTGDLDILIEPTDENGDKLISALSDLKLDIPDIKKEEFLKPLVLSFGFEPDAVDIINFTPGILFEEVFSNSIKVSFAGLNVPMIDIRDLIKNKESLNRQGEKSHLDKYDVEVLKKILQKNESK